MDTASQLPMSIRRYTSLTKAINTFETVALDVAFAPIA